MEQLLFQSLVRIEGVFRGADDVVLVGYLHRVVLSILVYASLSEISKALRTHDRPMCRDGI